MFDFNVIWLNVDVFINGLVITVLLTVLSIIFGTLLGIGLALMRRSENMLLKRFAVVYVDFFRAMPLIIMLIWLFFAMPIIIDIRIGAFWTAVIGLSLFLAAYMAETIRAGIESIPKGQIEAAHTLGLTQFQITRRIVLPQAFRIMLPPITGLYIEQLKNSTLTAIIAVNELLHVSQILISQTFRPLEIYSTVALLFVVIIWPLAYFSRRLEFSAMYKRGDKHGKYSQGRESVKRFW